MELHPPGWLLPESGTGKRQVMVVPSTPAYNAAHSLPTSGFGVLSVPSLAYEEAIRKAWDK